LSNNPDNPHTWPPDKNQRSPQPVEGPARASSSNDCRVSKNDLDIPPKSTASRKSGRSTISSIGFPGSAAPRTCAAWPVWADTTRQEVHFVPQPKKQLVKLWYKAKEWNARTKETGRHGGGMLARLGRTIVGRKA
jgi:hypothetical protein